MAYTTINNSKLYQNTMLYTGDDGTRNVTESGTFQADLVWLKRRNSAASHHLVDSVRGATKAIYSNATGAEATDSTGVTGFVTDGFSLGGQGGYNNNGDTFVSWTWKAGTSVSGNTTGSGTAKAYTGSVNTTAGFSIIKYLGNGSAGHTIPHHLGVTPEIIITKRLSDTGEWYVYSPVMGNTKHMRLNQTGAEDTANTIWNNTSPTSSVFTVGTNGDVNGNDNPIIAYSFNSIQGYSKMGSYTGNGSTTNNAFIYTGFKPSWFMCKRTDGAGSWAMFDNKRETFNDGNNSSFFADSNDAENVNDYNVEFFSNGIKTNASSDNIGRSGGTYLYMAFAEAPLVGTNNTPCTAR